MLANVFDLVSAWAESKLATLAIIAGGVALRWARDMPNAIPVAQPGLDDLGTYATIPLTSVPAARFCSL
jgi:hypothetical protein